MVLVAAGPRDKKKLWTLTSSFYSQGDPQLKRKVQCLSSRRANKASYAVDRFAEEHRFAEKGIPELKKALALHTQSSLPLVRREKKL